MLFFWTGLTGFDRIAGPEFLTELTKWTEFWILDSGFWILDFGFWILDSGFWILDFESSIKH